MGNWKLLYPYLFLCSPNDRMQILDIYHATLKGKRDHAPSIACAKALTSLYFFLLETIHTTGDNAKEELKNNFLETPENDRTSSLFRAHFVDNKSIEEFRNKLGAIVAGLSQDKRVAELVLRHSLDIILSSHMDTRLRIPQNLVFSSLQIQAQINFPLYEYNNFVDLLNEYMPNRGTAKFYEIKHVAISRTRREELIKTIDPEWKPVPVEPSINKSKATLLSSLLKERKQIVEDQRVSEMKSRGVVVVNPHKVQLRLRSKKEKVNKVDVSPQVIEKNEILALEFITQVGHTDVLAHLLSKRLKIVFSSMASYEQYCATLPKKPMYESDVFFDKLFYNYTIFYHLVGYIAQKEPIKLLDFRHVIKSLVVNCIGDWNSTAPTLLSGNEDQKLTERTLRILKYLQDAQWLVPPLSYVIEIIPYLKSAEIVQIMMSVFHFINNYAPKFEEYNSTEAGVKRTLPIECDVQLYMQSTKDALREHVTELSHIYWHFFTATD
jgi:hypothetical protein